MGILNYWYLKLGAVLLRALVRLQGRITSSPDDVWSIRSCDQNRSIKAHVYQSNRVSNTVPRPVLVNLHGSGFVIPAHGSDDAFCRQVSQQTDYIVFDIQYRLSPEHPFPAAVEDVEDVVNWILSQPQKFDLSRLAISGFSAGGTLALVAAAALTFPKGTFRSAIAFYPATECFTGDPGRLVAPEPGGNPLPAFMLRLFKRCYLRGNNNDNNNNVDPHDPCVSPQFADPSRFPENVMIISAGYDSLATEAERLAIKLQQEDDTRHVVHERMSGCDHAFDKTAEEGTRQWELREKAYQAAIAMLLG